MWLSTNRPSGAGGRGKAYQTSAVDFDCTRTSFTSLWRRCFRSGLESDSNRRSKSCSSRATSSKSSGGRLSRSSCAVICP